MRGTKSSQTQAGQRRRLCATEIISPTAQMMRETPPATHLASLSDSNSAKISLSLTGPLTLRMIEREESSMNSTRTWVTPPREPVLPRTLTTLASLTGVLEESCVTERGGEASEGVSVRPRDRFGDSAGELMCVLMAVLLAQFLLPPQRSPRPSRPPSSTVPFLDLPSTVSHPNRPTDRPAPSSPHRFAVISGTKRCSNIPY